MENIDSILAYWFGSDRDGDGDAAISQRQNTLWWSKDEAVDREIAVRFADCSAQAAASQLAHWRDTPHGWLALLLLTDQFPRNMYRGTPRAFASDPFALQAALDVIAQGIDRQVRPVQRVFFYMPLEHAESIVHQEHSVRLFTQLAEEVPAFDGFLGFARRHRDVVARFGRFPHRNAILGRPSSDAEIAFLQQPGSSF